MPTTPDYYEVLQVSPNADEEIIQAAHKRLVEKWLSKMKPGDSVRSVQILLSAGTAGRAVRIAMLDPQSVVTSSGDGTTTGSSEQAKSRVGACEHGSPSVVTVGCH